MKGLKMVFILNMHFYKKRTNAQSCKFILFPSFPYRSKRWIFKPASPEWWMLSYVQRILYGFPSRIASFSWISGFWRIVSSGKCFIRSSYIKISQTINFTKKTGSCEGSCIIRIMVFQRYQRPGRCMMLESYRQVSDDLLLIRRLIPERIQGWLL